MKRVARRMKNNHEKVVRARLGGTGGKREGAGRPKGSKNRATREALEMAKAAGITPLEYMLNVMRDSRAKIPRRDAMAIAAAPYIHPRLQTTKLEGSSPDGSIKHDHTIKVVFVRPKPRALPMLDLPAKVIENVGAQ